MKRVALGILAGAVVCVFAFTAIAVKTNKVATIFPWEVPTAKVATIIPWEGTSTLADVVPATIIPYE